MINTSNMHPEDFVSTIPAEACTHFGFEDEVDRSRWGTNTAQQFAELAADISILVAIAACVYAVFA